MSLEDISIYGNEEIEEPTIEEGFEDISIYGNVGLPSDRIEPCTRTITGEIEDKIPHKIVSLEKMVNGVSLDTNFILIILSILFIVFFLCCD